MKQKRSVKDLSLKKETIARLNDLESSKVIGGIITKTGCPSEWPCGTDYWGCDTDWLKCHPK